MDWTAFLFPALITLGLTFLAQWLLTNWKIRREFRIKLLEETFKPLYKLASDMLRLIEIQRDNERIWTAPEQLQDTIISDVRFSMLNEDERTKIEQAAVILTQYENTIRDAQRTLRPLWENPLHALIRNLPGPITASTDEQFRTTKERIRTVLRDGIWSAYMDQASPTAEDVIQEAILEPEVKTQLSELAQNVFQTFETTQEYKTYINTRDEALSIISDFKNSLTKWATSMFGFFSR